MPFYDYVCQACGRRIEVMHGVHATGPSRCDACGGQLQRVISRPAIHFKGSGWAKMDARAKSAKAGSGTAAHSGKTDEADTAKASKAEAAVTKPAPAPETTSTATSADEA